MDSFGKNKNKLVFCNILNSNKSRCIFMLRLVVIYNVFATNQYNIPILNGKHKTYEKLLEYCATYHMNHMRIVALK